MTPTPPRRASSCEQSSPTETADLAHGAQPEPAPEIGALFGPHRVGAATVTPHAEHVGALLADERPAVASMVPRRQAEFAAGRACARAAMVDVGAAPSSVLRTIDGTPVWPSALTGSISHTKGICVAVAANRSDTDLRAIGIDVEVIDRVSDAVERRILTEPERRWVAQLHGDARDQARAGVFAVKEAFYKAQHQITGRFLGFDVIAVEVHSDGTVTLRSLSPLVSPEQLASTQARVRIADGRIIAAVAMCRPVP